MAEWRKVNPGYTTGEFNRVYSNTYNSLTELSDVEDQPEERVLLEDAERRARGGGRDMVSEPRRLRMVKVKRPVTKGAFGKKKG